ncbi:MAG TPA: tetratricopeptide repeat protein, partial [Gemmataceae bacterium]|nr:tetratricopeptide repeat protein [Gemmataceae bacterium]
MNDDTQAYTSEGIALVNQGRSAEAVAYFEEAVRLEPNNAHVYNNLANVYLFMGRYDDAIANYRYAIHLMPGHAGYHNHLSYAYIKRSSGQDAEECARQAIWLQPDFAEAHNHLGIALGILKRYEEAEMSYRESLRLNPGFAHAHSNLAQLHVLQHRDDEALTHAETAIHLDPQLAEPYATRSSVYLRQNKLEEALASCQQALERNPQLPEAHLHLATAYLKQGRLAEAAAVCREVQRLRPDPSDPNHRDMEYILGMVALKENRLEDALGSFTALLRYKPEDAQIHFNRSLIWLLQGNYEQGWPEYEWRWHWKDFVVRPFAYPMWDGSPLDGKTIVLHAEQGIGDTLQFIRYAPLVKQRVSLPDAETTVIFACPKALLKVLSKCAGIDQLVVQETFTALSDEHISLLSLPTVLKTTVATIPADVPYIVPDSALVESWRGEIRAAPGFNIGIAWHGSPQHADNRHRSVPLVEFAPLRRVPGIRWFSLQKGPGQDQAATAPFDLVDLSPRLDEASGAFMDTAAVMK